MPRNLDRERQDLVDAVNVCFRTGRLSNALEYGISDRDRDRRDTGCFWAFFWRGNYAEALLGGRIEWMKAADIVAAAGRPLPVIRGVSETFD